MSSPGVVTAVVHDPPAALAGLCGGLWRNNLRLRRNVASIVSAFVIPALIMVAFWAVFGPAAEQAGFDYALYLLAAAMFQGVMFAAGGSSMALAVDAESGILHRLRAMPLASGMIVVTRLGTDLLRSVASVLTVVVLALLLGARPASLGALVVAIVMTLVIGLVLSMLFCGFALRSRHPVQASSLVQGIEMPLLMFSSAFIPTHTLPAWLQLIIDHVPFSPLINTVRALLEDTAPGAAGWEALAWLALGLIAGTVWVTKAMRRK